MQRHDQPVDCTPAGAPREMLEALSALSADAIRHVYGELYRRSFRDEIWRLEQAHLTHVKAVRFLFEYLFSAIELGTQEAFTDSLRWMVSVLEPRGLPVARLEDMLELLRGFFAARLAPAMQRPVIDALEAGVQVLREPGPVPSFIFRFQKELPPPLPVFQPFLTALLEGDRAQAQHLVVASLNSGLDLPTIQLRLFQPALYEIGRLWQTDRISVAQEHLATAISQDLMSRLLAQGSVPPPSPAQKAIFAGLEGNHHTIGLLMVSNVFELAGWTVQYLGGDVPSDALVQQVDRLRPNLLGLTAALLPHIHVARTVIERLRSDLGSACPTVMVGGLAMNQDRSLWRTVGADVWCPSLKEVEEFT